MHKQLNWKPDRQIKEYSGLIPTSIPVIFEQNDFPHCHLFVVRSFIEFKPDKWTAAIWMKKGLKKRS